MWMDVFFMLTLWVFADLSDQGVSPAQSQEGLGSASLYPGG